MVSKSFWSEKNLSETIFATKDSQAQELARAMGEEWNLTLYANRPSGSPMAILTEIGKAAITVELGGRSSTAPGAFYNVGEILSRAALNIMKHYKMIEGEPTYPNKRYKGYQQALLAPESGVFLPETNTKFHQIMKKNDINLDLKLAAYSKSFYVIDRKLMLVTKEQVEERL